LASDAPKAYQRTVLPSLSGITGIKAAATRGSTMTALSQGNELNMFFDYVERVSRQKRSC
jgi:hypothetical protein